MLRKIKSSELAQRILFTLMMVIIMQLGKNIAIPFINGDAAHDVLKNNQLLQNFSIATGGQVNYPSLFSIGLGPYMTGMILFQAIRLLDVDSIKKMSEYQVGITQRLITLVIAVLQSIQLLFPIRNHIQSTRISIFGVNGNFAAALVVLIAGAMVMSWMSDMTAQKGIGGSGILIFPGIMVALPRILVNGQGLGTGPWQLNAGLIAIITILILIVVVLVVFVNKAELRIPLQRPMIENDFSESYVPIRVLTAGGMPFMFSTTLFMIPTYIIASVDNESIGRWILRYIAFNQPVGIAIYTFIVVLLGYAFSFMNFKPEETVKGLKESGDYFFGIVPGFETQQFLTRKLVRLTTFANVFMVAIIITPLIIGMYIDGVANLTFVFSNIFILVTVLDNLIEQARVLYLRTQYNLLEI